MSHQENIKGFGKISEFNESNYDGPERRVSPIGEELIEQIAERAAEKAIARLTSLLYQEIGKSVVSKALTVIGVISLLLTLWASSKGLIKIP